MSDLLQRGSDWLAGQLKMHASREVSYERGAQQVTVRAVMGRKDFEVDSTEGKLYFKARDFLIHRVDLVLDGQATLPERGDKIVVDFGSGLETFEVLPGDGVPHWEFSDVFCTFLRIHTQKVN